MNKYEKLFKYLKDNNKDSYTLTFTDIYNILGFNIDHSFLNYKKDIINYGYEVLKISLKNKNIIFRKKEK